MGVLGRVGERGHPGGRRQREQRRASARSCNFSGRPQVDARSGATFRCIPDPATDLPSLPPTRPTIGMLNLASKIPSSVSVSGSSRRIHRAKPRARSIWADFAVAEPLLSPLVQFEAPPVVRWTCPGHRRALGRWSAPFFSRVRFARRRFQVPAQGIFFVATSSKIYGRKRRKPRESERTGESSVIEIPNLPLGSASRTPCRPLACVASPE